MKALTYLTSVLNFFKRIPPKWRKYVISFVLFMVYLTFFDANNLFFQWDQIKERNQLRRDIVFYEKSIKEDKERSTNLSTDPRLLERFAREEYLMKKDNEDVIVFVEEEEKK